MKKFLLRVARYSLLFFLSVSTYAKPLSKFIAETNTSITINTPSVCFYESMTLTSVLTGNTVGPPYYQWSDEKGTIATNGNSQSYTVTKPGTYYLIVYDDISVYKSNVITINPKPMVNITASAGSLMLCPESSTQLTANGASTYSWSPSVGLSDPNSSTPIAAPDKTTTYIVTGTDAAGCSNTDQVVVTVRTTEQPIISGSSYNCNTNDYLATISNYDTGNTYYWTVDGFLLPPSNSQTISIKFTQSITNLSVFAISSVGCRSQTAEKLIQGQNITAPLPQQINSLSYCATQNHTVSYQGVIPAAYELYWYDDINGTNLIGTGQTITFTENKNTTYKKIFYISFVNLGPYGNIQCESNKVMYSYQINSKPSITYSFDQDLICENLPVTLTLNGATKYTINNIVNTGNQYEFIANSANTSFLVIGTDQNSGCSSTVTIPLPTFKPKLTNVAIDPITICSGEVGKVMPKNVYGLFTYYDSNMNILGDNNAAQTFWNVSGLTTTTTFFASRKDLPSSTEYCPSDITSFVVTVNPRPIVNGGLDLTSCAGNSIQFNAKGATSYSWSPASAFSNPTSANAILYQPSISTTVTVTGTDMNGCTNTDDVVITIIPQPTVVNSSSNNQCGGTVLDLTSANATTFQWTPTTGLSNPNVLNPIVLNPTSITTYTLTASNNVGCRTSMNINIYPTPTLNAGPDKSICRGSSAIINISGYGFSNLYVWNSNQSNWGSLNTLSFMAQPTTTTTYTFKGTNQYGCVITDQVVVNVMDISVDAGTDKTVCINALTQLNATGSNGIVSYRWIASTPVSFLTGPNIANPTYYATTTRTFTIEATNSMGCKATDQVTITVLPDFKISAGKDVYICSGTSTQLNATSLNNTIGAVNYLWTPAIGLSNPNIANPIATCNQTTIYNVRAYNTNACSSTGQVTVYVVQTPDTKITANVLNNHSCSGDKVTLTTSGSYWNNYTWVPNQGIKIINALNYEVAPTSTTTYTVIGKYGASNTVCTSTASITITVSPKPIVNAGLDQSVCAGQGQSLQMQASGSGYITAKWSPATFLSDPNILNPVVINPTTTTLYTLTLTNAQGCVSTDQVLVTVSLKNVNAGPDQIICKGSTLNLNATVSSNYLTSIWSSSTATLSNPTILNPTISPIVTSTFTLKVTDKQGCTAQDDVVITVSPIANTINAGLDQGYCTGGSATLNASGSTSYIWSPSTGLSNTTSANPTATPTSTTTYTVRSNNSPECISSDQVIITVVQKPSVDAGSDIIFCEGQGFYLRGYVYPTTANFQWSSPTQELYPLNKKDIFVYDTPTNSVYTLTASTTSGGSNPTTCLTSDALTVMKIPKPYIDYSGDIWSGKTMYAHVGVLPPGVTASKFRWYNRFGLDQNANHNLYSNCNDKSICKSNSVLFFQQDWYVEVTYVKNRTEICTLRSGSIVARVASPNIDELETENIKEEVLVYPIPSNQNITVEYFSKNTIEEISIVDMLGNTIMSIKNQTNKTEIDLSSVPTGIYILRLTDSIGIQHPKRIEVSKK